MLALLVPLALAASPGPAPAPSSCGRALCTVSVFRDHHLDQTVTLPQGGRDLEVELGDDIGSARIEVISDSSRSDRVIVEERWQTSLSISGEGPHLDLVDWLHRTSGWIVLGRDRDGLFLSQPWLAPPFPAFDAGELENEVRRGGGGDAWVDRARDCAESGDGCFVGPSRLWLRITAWKDGNLVETEVLDFAVPMGC